MGDPAEFDNYLAVFLAAETSNITDDDDRTPPPPPPTNADKKKEDDLICPPSGEDLILGHSDNALQFVFQPEFVPLPRKVVPIGIPSNGDSSVVLDTYLTANYYMREHHESDANERRRFNKEVREDISKRLFHMFVPTPYRVQNRGAFNPVELYCYSKPLLAQEGLLRGYDIGHIRDLLSIQSGERHLFHKLHRRRMVRLLAEKQIVFYDRMLTMIIFTDRPATVVELLLGYLAIVEWVYDLPANHDLSLFTCRPLVSKHRANLARHVFRQTKDLETLPYPDNYLFGLYFLLLNQDGHLGPWPRFSLESAILEREERIVRMKLILGFRTIDLPQGGLPDGETPITNVQLYTLPRQYILRKIHRCGYTFNEMESAMYLRFIHLLKLRASTDKILRRHEQCLERQCNLTFDDYEMGGLNDDAPFDSYSIEHFLTNLYNGRLFPPIELTLDGVFAREQHSRDPGFSRHSHPSRWLPAKTAAGLSSIRQYRHKEYEAYLGARTPSGSGRR